MRAECLVCGDCRAESTPFQATSSFCIGSFAWGVILFLLGAGLGAYAMAVLGG